jgi:hypothetical protein
MSWLIIKFHSFFFFLLSIRLSPSYDLNNDFGGLTWIDLSRFLVSFFKSIFQF